MIPNKKKNILCACKLCYKYYIKYIHKKYYIHRNIKLYNFLMNNKFLYIINLGFAKLYRDLFISYIND